VSQGWGSQWILSRVIRVREAPSLLFAFAKTLLSLFAPYTLVFLKNLRNTNESVWNCPMGSEAVAGNRG